MLIKFFNINSDHEPIVSITVSSKLGSHKNLGNNMHRNTIFLLTSKRLVGTTSLVKKNSGDLGIFNDVISDLPDGSKFSSLIDFCCTFTIMGMMQCLSTHVTEKSISIDISLVQSND